MKILFRLLFLLAVVFISAETFAQVSINTTGAPPNSNAMLDISSNTKGVLLPRMSAAQRMAIPSPKTGLMVFDSTTASFWFYQTNAWRELATGSTSSDSVFQYGQQVGTPNSYNTGATAIYQDSSGYLYDSGGPGGNYSNNENDTTYIYSADPNVLVIRLQILSNNLENFYDSLIISDATGHSVIFSGTQTGSVLMNQYARVVFRSNNIVTAPGFKIKWDLVYRPLNTAESSPPSSGWYYIPQEVAVKGGLNFANEWSKDSTGFLSFDWGQNNAVKGIGATALGLNNTVLGTYGFTAGQRNMVTGNYAAALNQSNSASGNSSFVGGKQNKAVGDFAFSFGQNSVAGGDWSVAIGNRDSAMLIGDFALGTYNIAKGGNSFASGYNSITTGSGSAAIGENCYAAGKDAFAVNRGTYALGKYSFAAGYFSESDGDYSVAMGNEAYAKGSNCFAAGYQTEADGIYSTALGYLTNAVGSYSLATGAVSTAGGSISSTLGLGTITKGYASTAVGEYNDSILTVNQTSVSAGTPLFIVGNGDNHTTRSNALVVLKNGMTGIGNIIPQQNLSVNAGMNIDQASANIGTIANTLTFGGASGEGIGSKRTAGGNGGGLDFYTANSPRMLITNTGGIGIGNILPQQNLSVNLGMNIDQASVNNGTIANTLTFGGTSGEGIGSKRTATGNQNGLDVYTAGTARLSVTNTGKIGIGTTSPGAKLQINQAGNYSNSESADHALEIWDNQETLYMGADEANDISYIQAVGNNFLHTLALNPRTGNVAIGKPTATVPLDVNGDIKTSGNIMVQNDRGIVRNSGTAQLKMVVTGSVFTGTAMPAFATNSGSVTFSQVFTTPPVVYVANVLQDGANALGSTDKVLISFTNVTNTGCIVSIRNTHNAAITFDGNWQIVAMGAQ